MKAAFRKRLILSIILVSFFCFSSQAFAAAPDNWRWVERNTGLGGSGGAGKLVIDPNNTDILYSLVNSYGVYKSTDGGDNWTASNTGLPSGIAQDLKIDPNDSNTLYVIIAWTIYKSSDAGANWSESHTGIRSWGVNNGIRFIEVDPTDSDILYAGTVVSGDNGGVWKSTDAGANWTQVAGNDLGSGCDNDIGPFAIDPTNNQKIYAGSGYYGVYISTNGGSNWSTDSQTTANIYQIVIDADDHDKVYAADTNGLYVTTDGGENWSLSEAISGRLTDLAQNSANHEVMFSLVLSGSDRELYKTINRGSSWTNLDHASLSVHELESDPTDADTLYMFSSGSGPHKSTDGGTTTDEKNTGLPSIPVQIWRIQTDGSNLFAVTRNGLFKSSDGGINWTLSKSLSSIARGEVVFNPDNADEIYYAANSILYKSSDGGETWNTHYTSTESYLFSIAIDPDTPTTLFATTSSDKYIMKSTDGGETWNTKETLASSSFDIKVDPNDSNKVYAPTNSDYFWRSTDGGESWSKVTSGLGAGLGFFVTIDGTNDVLYAPKNVGSTIYKSTNWGEAWTSLNTGIIGGGPYLIKVVVDSSDASILYVPEGTTGIVYKSTDGGTTWSALTTQGQPAGNIVLYLAQDPSDSTRLLAGHNTNAGIYSYENHIPVFSTSTISVADENGGVVEAGDTLTYIIAVTNSGWADGNDINLRVDIPSGLTYVTNSTKIDGTTVSPDPTSSPTLNISLGDESKDESIIVTFRATVNSGTGIGTTIGVSGTITSDEDILGTLTSTGYIIVGQFPTSSIGIPGATCGKSSPLSPTALRGIPGPQADQATLYWEQPSSGETTHYALAYGEKSSNYLYGATNIGNQTSYTISGLESCTDYYFTVAAVNDCASSSYSHEFKVKTSCLLVKEGEEEEMVRESEEELIKTEEEKEEEEGVREEGYDVKVKVVDEKKDPVQGAKVTLFSEPRETITDEQGIALFNNVEGGEHRILIAYQNQQGEQEVNLQGEVREFDFTIRIKQTNPFLSTSVILVIGLLTLIIGILLFLYIKKKS